MNAIDDRAIDDHPQSSDKESDDYNEGEETESKKVISIDLSAIDITDDVLKRIERKLCLIRLCWPTVNLEDSHLSRLPASYRTVTDKEKLLMWYAENFRKQYHTVYADRKPLLMVCDNECGIQKFVSTSIRPSTLPYPELYTWQGCANFVSDHLEYEPPKKPLDMPERLCSPTWLMRCQRGNAFEYATLLTSLLLGKGYNAFVVSGYASREQVHCDQSMRKCPYLPEPTKPPTPAEPADTSRYRLKTPPDFRSKLLLELEAEENRKKQEKIDIREMERQKMLIEYERPSADDYYGNRVHAWVVILPETDGPRDREIRAPVFVESTSGSFYSIDDDETNLLYHGIESVWNDSNYWINLQPCSDGCSKIHWDLINTDHWEHLLPGEPWTMRGIDDDDETDANVHVERDKHLDMPFSYVDDIHIHSLDFERRYPNGTKTVYFKKTKVEFYAPYVQMDGLIRKVTSYEDYDYRSPTLIHEKYSNRADNLVESKKIVDTATIIDYYEKGRADGCKEHRYSTIGNERIDELRILDFYDVVRTDGLSRIEMDPLHMTQHYAGRKDLLYYRHVEFSSENERSPQDIHYRTITKIIEKYHRNCNIAATKDIATREFAINENEIRLKCHYEKFDITRATRTFVKPPMVERGDCPTFDPNLIREYNPDPMSIPEKQLNLYYQLDEQLKDETKCLALIRESESEIFEFLKSRNAEYAMPKLLVSLFDKNRNEEAKAGILAKEEQLRAQNQREVENEVDYLGPYLARLGNPSQLTKVQALQVRKDCLNDLKKMLTDRANRMSLEFEECGIELNDLQNWFTETEGKTKETEEKMLKLTNEMNFQLHTLEVRLQRHCELSSERYRNMVKILKADKRLSSIFE